ncbi:hypothetical protein [Caballeronia glebae]
MLKTRGRSLLRAAALAAMPRGEIGYRYHHAASLIEDQFVQLIIHQPASSYSLGCDFLSGRKRAKNRRLFSFATISHIRIV